MSGENNVSRQNDEATRLAGLLELDNDPKVEASTEPDRPEDLHTLHRRKFLRRLCYGVGGIGAALAVIPVAGFVVLPLFNQPPDAWREVGPTGQFQKGQTVEVKFDNAAPHPWGGAASQSAAWLRVDQVGQFWAYSIDCTHLGCPVDWRPEANLFMCPCHGGVFYEDGSVAAGPPPQPLARYPLRIRDGKVEIKTSPLPIT
jgi:menaquinol-cytochrome c reductase iron-sulfur subunit